MADKLNDHDINNDVEEQADKLIKTMIEYMDNAHDASVWSDM